MKDNFNPDNFTKSPYDCDRTPPPSVADLAQLGLGPKSDEKAVPVTTRVRPSLVYAIDRILERKVYNVKTRHDFFRLALMNLITSLEDEIQNEQVLLVMHRLENQRRRFAEVTEVFHAMEMVKMTIKTAVIFLNNDDRGEAIRTLREAKRYSEEIRYEGLRQRFINMMYGSVTGDARPDGWEDNSRAVLWDRVLTGEYDLPEDQE